MVGTQVRGGLSSWTEIKSQAVKEATSYCSAKGLEANVADIETSGARGWTPQNAEVKFSCVERE